MKDRRVVVVGSGVHFISGISYYTHKLAITLAKRHEVGVILMRRLIPRFLYPGRERVGAAISDLAYPDTMTVIDGIDWYGGPNLIRALWLIGRRRPDALILQWWTGAVLHSYLALAFWAKVVGTRVIVEFHEIQDTGEAKVFGAALYVKLAGRLLIAMTSGVVVHSESDLEPVQANYGIGDRPCSVITHGPLDHYPVGEPLRDAPSDCLNILFFGTIRPYKGLEDLVQAFNDLDRAASERLWLTVVGETWEGWTGPLDLIDQSPYRSRITLVNRYVTDEEIGRYLAGADGVALPYRRSSASGPLHVTMSAGLPVIVTEVGGLPEAAAGYRGAIWVPPADPEAVQSAFRTLAQMAGKHFEDPSSWERTADQYEDLLERVESAGSQR